MNVSADTRIFPYYFSNIARTCEKSKKLPGKGRIFHKHTLYKHNTLTACDLDRGNLTRHPLNTWVLQSKESIKPINIQIISKI